MYRHITALSFKQWDLLCQAKGKPVKNELTGWWHISNLKCAQGYIWDLLVGFCSDGSITLIASEYEDLNISQIIDAYSKLPSAGGQYQLTWVGGELLPAIPNITLKV